MLITKCDCSHCCPHGLSGDPTGELICECQVEEEDTPCEGDWEKLNDKAVFCRKCGDINTVEPEPCCKPHYPCQLPHYPHYPWYTTTTTNTAPPTTITY